MNDDEDEVLIETWHGVPKQGTLAARIRYVADGPHPWIPGADADFIRELADDAVAHATLRAAVQRYIDSWEGLAMGDCAYPEELETLMRVKTDG